MSNPFHWSFDHIAPASALFFRNGHHKALRVEVPTIDLEFIDNVNLGKDPSGFLYYDSLDDFKTTTHHVHGVVHHYKVLESVVEGKTYAIIEFRRDHDTDAYAKFIAEDPTKTVSRAGMNHYTHTGSWVKLVLGSSMATVEKSSTNSNVTLYVDAIKKKATWSVGSTLFNPKGFTVDGNLYFKDVSKLQDGVHANYNNDRIIFYENHYSGKDFTAYFIPSENSNSTLGTKEPHTFSGVSWIDM